MHGLLEVDGIEHLDTVGVALQELSTFDEDAAFQNDLSRTSWKILKMPENPVFSRTLTIHIFSYFSFHAYRSLSDG